jgi:hypothetical protein
MIRSLLVILLLAGCSTHSDRVKDVRSAYHAGNLNEAKNKINTVIEKNPRDAEVLKLDQASIYLTEGRPKEAEAILREVRDRFDYLEQKDIREGIMSVLTDDQRVAYSGEDYEKVLIRFMLAMSNLLQDGSDATAYALQVNAKQQEIIEAGKGTGPEGKNFKEGYKLVAAGSYLHAVLKEATHTSYDDVARSLQQVAQWQPDFSPIQKDIERAKNGRHSQPGHGVVYVFTMVGRGPEKQERAEVVSQVSLFIADRILSAAGKQSLPPTIAPIKVPVVVRPFNDIAKVTVGVNGQMLGQTETLTDIGQMATQQAEAILPEKIAHAVVRRIVKKGIVYGVKEAIGTDKSTMTSFALNVAGVAWEATESADTRSWSLLPDKIQVLRIEFPAGDHQLLLQPANANGAKIGSPESVTVRVEDGRNTYVLANFPGSKLAGKISSNRLVR